MNEYFWEVERAITMAMPTATFVAEFCVFIVANDGAVPLRFLMLRALATQTTTDHTSQWSAAINMYVRHKRWVKDSDDYPHH